MLKLNRYEIMRKSSLFKAPVKKYFSTNLVESTETHKSPIRKNYWLKKQATKYDRR